MAIHFYTYF